MIYIKKFLSKVVKYVRPQYLIFSQVRTCKCCGKKSLILRLNGYDEFTRCIRCSANSTETQRVLKPGGKHIFTVPMYEGTTRRRAELIDGDVVNYLPPEYHCDPEADGSGYILAFWNFGTDLATKYSNNNLKLSVINGPFGKEGKMVWCAEKIS